MDDLKSIPKINHFTCQSLKELYIQSLVSTFHGKCLFLEGFYKDLGRKISKGNYYDAVYDKGGNVSIAFRISAYSKALLEDFSPLPKSTGGRISGLVVNYDNVEKK